MPLILWTIYEFINTQSIKNSILLGLVYGIIGITHSIAFIASSMLLGFVFIYYGVMKNLHVFKNKNSKDGSAAQKGLKIKKIIKIVLPYVIVLVIGVCIAMLWWYKPIFLYHGQTSPHYTEWNNTDFSSISAQFQFLWYVISGALIYFGNMTQAVLSTLFIAGVLGMIFIKSKKNSDDPGADSARGRIQFIRFLLISSLIVTLHYFVTQNIIGVSFVPGYMSYLLLEPVRIIVAAFGAYVIYSMIKKKIKSDAGKRYFTYIFFPAIILLLLIGLAGLYNDRMNDQWYNAGKSALPAQLVSLEDYVTAHTSVYDTILTTKEVGFAVNALTGRKLVISRRAHNDPFMNLDPREMDAAVILYGDNVSEKINLIKEYNITYLYWDTYWIQSEYTFNDQGQITGWFDPIIAFYSPENEQVLKDNNVSYFVQNTWVDPALRSDSQKKFDLIFVSPQNYVSFTHPWKTDIDPYLKEVWSYSSGGQKIAVLYKVNV